MSPSEFEEKVNRLLALQLSTWAIVRKLAEAQGLEAEGVVVPLRKGGA